MNTRSGATVVLAVSAVTGVVACSPDASDDAVTVVAQEAFFVRVIGEFGFPCDEVLTLERIDTNRAGWHVTCANARVYVAYTGEDGSGCISPVPVISDLVGHRGMGFVVPEGRCAPDVRWP